MSAGFQKHAWLIFFILGIGAVIAAPIQLAGNPPNPPSAEGTTGLTVDEITADARGPG